MTLKEFLEKVSHPTKFNNNDNIFKNQEHLKNEESESDEEVRPNYNPTRPWNHPNS